MFLWKATSLNIFDFFCWKIARRAENCLMSMDENVMVCVSKIKKPKISMRSDGFWHFFILFHEFILGSHMSP